MREEKQMEERRRNKKKVEREIENKKHEYCRSVCLWPFNGAPVESSKTTFSKK